MITKPLCLHETAWCPRGKMVHDWAIGRPSHHLRATWHSAWSRCKPKPCEGVAVIQDPAKGADTERSHALLTREEEEYKD